MKKLILIFLLLVSIVNLYGRQRTFISTSSTSPSNPANFSNPEYGAITSEDTAIFDGSGTVNVFAGADFSWGGVIKRSTFTRNWNMNGKVLTITSGVFIDSSTVGTSDYGAGLSISGTDTKFITSSQNGTVTAASCVFTINSTTSATITDNKGVRFSNIIVNCPVHSNGTGRIDTRALSGTSPLTLGANGSWAGPANMALRSSANTTMINMQPTSVFNPSGSVYLVSSHASGSITLTIPEINCEAFFYFENWGTAGNSVVYSMSGDLNCYKLSTEQTSSTSGNVTLQTNGHDVRAFMWYYGSQKLTCRGYLEADNSYISIYDFEGNKNTDSTFWSLNNATVHNSNKWVHGTKELFAGTYALQTFTDLYMGHSMFSAQQIIAPPQYWYEKNYAGRYWKNRSIGSQLISEVNTRLDSCLTAYSPSRFFMYIGQNDLDITDSATFDAAMVSYYIEWTDIINRVKAANIDSIYIVEMSPTGTIAAPMAAERVRNYRRFNISLRDSCNERGLFFIPTFDSLLEPGYNDVLKVSTTIDGVHPNSTISGSQYTGYLLTLAQAPTVTFRQSTDTLKLVCSNNQNVESWQWYKNNVAISGATDSVLPVVVDSTSATKSVYYCEISNGAENKKVGDWTIERKANGRVVSRKNKYK